MHFEHPVHDWNVAALEFEHADLAHADRVGFVAEPQEENVAALVGGLHAAAEHDDHGAVAASEDHQAW